MPEQQNVEYKQSWRDEYLKWICGFANAQGGRIFIGLDDNGIVAGIEDYKKLMDDIPNKAVNHLGLVVDVNLHHQSGKPYIEIVVPVSNVPIAYHGVYHYRSGSTKQELKGIALQNLLLKKIGKKWEDMPVENVSLKDIDENTIQTFIFKAIEKERIPSNSGKIGKELLLKNLSLVIDQGQLTNAGLPEPLIEEDQGGFSITFLKDIYTEEILKGYDLEDRYIKALLFIKTNKRITNKQYQDLFNVSKRTASYDLHLLLERNLISKTGSTGKGTYYTLQRGNKGAIGAPKGQ
jgi:predicted HTH transcriptional regulator